MDGLIYSYKEKIPLFKLTCDHTGERYVEYLNTRNGQTELIKVSRLVVYLLNKESSFIKEYMSHSPDESEHKVISPEEGITLGYWVQDFGTFYIEVKYKKRREKLTVAAYVKLLLESEALKAS